MIQLSPDHIALIGAQIGKPWKRAGTGPDAFDCAGLFKVIQEQVFGRIIPLNPADYANENGRKQLLKALSTGVIRETWQEVPGSDDPATWQTGDGIVMRNGQDLHIATYIDLGRGQKHLLESTVGRGVEFLTLAAWRARKWPEIYAIRYREAGHA